VIRFFLMLLCLGAFGQTLAETRYVTDQFEITLRTGESTRHKIIRMLPSGTPVELLGTNPDNGYARVQTEDGTSGYVLERQLLEEPIARERIADLETRLQELQQEPEQLTARLAELQNDHASLRAEHEELQSEKGRLEQELATIRHASANVVRITEERTELRQSVADLTRQVAELQQENRDLGNQTTQRWFLIGAGVVVAGILIGLILPHLRFRRRRSSWGSL
jgi:SH3 domain protein